MTTRGTWQDRINRLPEAQKLAATLLHYERLDERAVSAALGIEVAPAKALIEQTRESLAAPLTRSEIRGAALACERALAARLEQVTGRPLGSANRAVSREDAFVRTVSKADRRLALSDVEAGDGSELRAPDPPRFHSARSSCALAVNTFAPWRRDSSTLRVAGLGDFASLTFECKLPTGLRGTPPNLDIVADGPTILAVESKLIEYLSPKRAKFSGSYGTVVSSMSPGWRARYNELVDDPGAYLLLDAAQLVKHYLGIGRKVGASRRAVLVYLYWEPEDADAHPAFAAHRADVERFAAGLDDPRVQFRSETYGTLWSTFARRPELRTHVAALRERYSVRAFS